MTPQIKKTKVNNTTAIKKLKDSGYEVNIKHFRDAYRLTPSKHGWRFLSIPNIPYYRRGNQILSALSSGPDDLVGVNPKGGMTVVRIYKKGIPNSDITAVAMCHSEDAFCYSVGVKSCLDKIYSQIQ